MQAPLNISLIVIIRIHEWQYACEYVPEEAWVTVEIDVQLVLALRYLCASYDVNVQSDGSDQLGKEIHCTMVF